MPEPLGDRQYCGYETDRNEICGATTTHHAAGTVPWRKNPLSDVLTQVRVNEFLCAEHAAALHANSPHLRLDSQED